MLKKHALTLLALLLSPLCFNGYQPHAETKALNALSALIKTSDEGKLLLPKKQLKPVASSNQARIFFQQAVMNSLNVNFLQYRQQLQRASYAFNDIAWQQMIATINNPKLLPNLLKNKLLLSATPTAAPLILSEGSRQKQYRWQVQMPLKLTLQNSQSNKQITAVASGVVATCPATSCANGLMIIHASFTSPDISLLPAKKSTAISHIKQTSPLDQQAMVDFSRQVIPQIFTFNFINYHSKFLYAASKFTPQAEVQFKKIIQKMQLVELMKKNKLTISAVQTDPIIDLHHLAPLAYERSVTNQKNTHQAPFLLTLQNTDIDMQLPAIVTVSLTKNIKPTTKHQWLIDSISLYIEPLHLTKIQRSFKQAQREKQAAVEKKKKAGASLIALLANTKISDKHCPAPKGLFLTSKKNIMQKVATSQQANDLSAPVLSDKDIQALCKKIARAVFTYDYIHYKKQVMCMRQWFSDKGFHQFVRALADSNNVDAVIHKKLFVSAITDGTCKIINQGIINGKYRWRVRSPLLVSYSNKQLHHQQKNVVTILLKRTTRKDNPLGVSAEEIAVMPAAPEDTKK